MNRKELRSTSCHEHPNKSGWRAYMRRFFNLSLMASALLLCNKASAQTITVDGNPSDWPAVLAGGSATVTAYKADPVNDKSDDKWTMGSQPVDPISGWHWKYGNVNDKEDMGNTGIAVIGRNLYFFADLHSSNGDASIGLWLLKGGTAMAANGTFYGVHLEGDILVSVLFTNGHVTATPTIYKWMNGALTKVNVGANAAGAAVNGAPVASPFPYTPKKNDGDPGTYPTNTFFEGFINLDSVINGADPCFANALFQTWESQSEHAALSDLVLLEPIRVKCGCRCMGWKPASPATIALAEGYSIYPNPSDGTFKLNVPAMTSDAVAVVIDLYGRVVDKRIITKSDNEQQVNYKLGVSPGIYYIRVDNNDTHYSDKITVK